MIRTIELADLTSLNCLASNFNVTFKNEDFNQENNRYMGYFEGNTLIAFINYAVYYERAEINYIFVLEEYRKNKVATKLLQYMFKQLVGLENITLEVRESNVAAIKLYEANGFSKCTVRKNYYGNEDALMMIKKLGD